jgi:uncharacterized protein YdcH (DUF465 family)
MTSERDMLDTLCLMDPELAAWCAEHRALDSKIDRLSRRRSISPEEAQELRRLKKIKLARRDAIDARLRGVAGPRTAN